MHRELGLLVWGNPQEYDVPHFVDEPIHDAFCRWLERHGRPENEAIWDATYGTDFPEHSELIVRSYDWGWDGEDGEMLANIEFGGVRIWWYKYLGRSMTTDCEMTDQQWREWMARLAAWVEDAGISGGSERTR